MIYWYCTPLEYKNSWIWKYSSLYIAHLQKIYDIKDMWLSVKPKSFIRIVLQFLIYPFHMIFHHKKIKVFSDEWWLPVLFFWIKNSIFIIHDIRDFNLTTKHSSFLLNIYFKIIKKCFKKLNANNVLKIICPSNFTKNELIKLWIKSNKIEVIYNSINKDYKKLNINKAILKKELFTKYDIWFENLDKNVLFNIGTEEDRKNIITILKVLKKINNYIFIKIWNPIIKNNRDNHLKFVKDNNINAIFLHNLEWEDIIKFYNIGDLYLNTSLFEWFGRTIIEAQACWCPVLSTYNSWLKEVLWVINLKINAGLDEKEILWKIELILKSIEKKEYLIKFWLENSKKFLLEKSICKWDILFKWY